MTDSAIDERRLLRGLGIGATILAFVSWLAWWSPQDTSNYDRDPSCQPGLAQIATAATPDTLNICVPDSILDQVYRVLPPR